MSKKCLKTVVFKQLEKMKSLEFLLLVFGLLGWSLALLEPSVRGKFIEIVGGLCSKIQW